PGVAGAVLRRENRINEYQESLKRNHVRRLNENACDLKAGIIFMDLVDNFEKVGDHLTNVAQAVQSEMRWKGEKSPAESCPVS
ncbi:MAG: hypothetical protein GF392_04400, partial [Candidatus Omnitrophica bacterium]|nr:hypothetical protein [Candidatus Omnitrophota bacterium]